MQISYGQWREADVILLCGCSAQRGSGHLCSYDECCGGCGVIK